MNENNSTLYNHLDALYGATAAAETLARLEQLLDDYRPRLPEPGPRRLTEQDAVLITYGDMVQAKGIRPLRTLAHFLSSHIQGTISTVHILPFYPYSSDDGFSVIDYTAVDPNLGDWADVTHLGRHFRLMFDAVINHISAQSDWFRRFREGDPDYQDYFVTVEPDTDLSQVFRPRALPLLTAVATAAGEKWVWTTFSEDQIDLNFANPAVFLRIMEVLLFYVAQGAEWIRLDAIAFMWKEIGSNSLHRPQTHRLIQLFRAVLDRVAPQLILITETNVPHKDNVSYFGNGFNEAQMVYNFSLPPLTLHSFHSGNATALSQWAASLRLPSDQTTFFNFLASHDGIGVTPARDLLSPAEIEALAQRVLALGGRVSYRHNADGSQTPYELNLNYLDALGDPDQIEADPALAARRFLAAQAIMLALPGVPGIYFHSLFGSQSWPEGVAATGRNRTINREKLDRDRLEQELADTTSLRHQVFYPYLDLLQKRSQTAAFHPNGSHKVMFYDEAVFALLRQAPQEGTAVLCLHNVANHSLPLSINSRQLPWPAEARVTDMVNGREYQPENGSLELVLEPYAVCWLTVRE
jgi:glucosylglycerate phosphorylase